MAAIYLLIGFGASVLLAQGIMVHYYRSHKLPCPAMMAKPRTSNQYIESLVISLMAIFGSSLYWKINELLERYLMASHENGALSWVAAQGMLTLGIVLGSAALVSLPHVWIPGLKAAAKVSPILGCFALWGSGLLLFLLPRALETAFHARLLPENRNVEAAAFAVHDAQQLHYDAFGAYLSDFESFTPLLEEDPEPASQGQGVPACVMQLFNEVQTVQDDFYERNGHFAHTLAEAFAFRINQYVHALNTQGQLPKGFPKQPERNAEDCGYKKVEIIADATDGQGRVRAESRHGPFASSRSPPRKARRPPTSLTVTATCCPAMRATTQPHPLRPASDLLPCPSRAHCDVWRDGPCRHQAA